uniref:HEG n=1 Tax=Stichopathes sp. SCBUCN-8850 TaxID=2848155 RepID=A0A8F2E5Z5_9CNID|nr:HEG [Stichopathes sp. SCBUCN-8850]
MINLQKIKDSKYFQWLLGFIEAESRFYISKRKFYGEEKFYVAFSIYQPLKKAQFLYHIKRLFGYGHIKTINVMESSQSQLKLCSSNVASSYDRRFIFSDLELLESSNSTYYITNKNYLTYVLFFLKQSVCSWDMNQKRGQKTFKFYDFEKTLKILTLLKEKRPFHLIEDIEKALKEWKRDFTDLGPRLFFGLKFPKEEFFENWFIGFSGGKGAFIISFKSHAEYEIKNRFYWGEKATYEGFQKTLNELVKKLITRPMSEGLKSEKEIILSFVIAQKTKDLLILEQLKNKLSGHLNLKFNIKGSTYIWEVSNEKALVLIKVLFKKYSLRTKKVEFLKWWKSLNYVIKSQPRFYK